jgi:hypothetical protein
MAWESDNSIDWFTLLALNVWSANGGSWQTVLLLNAIWNSLSVVWNSTTVNWDEVGTTQRQGWNNDNEISWYSNV